LAERKGVSAMAYSMRLVKQFKNEFDQSIVKDLQSKKDRFPDCEKLIDKWNSLHVQEQSLPQDLKTLLEIANHISVANVLLEEPRAYCELMEYEVPLPGGQEKIDFRLHYKESQINCDVKTIQPEPKNEWEAYKAFMQKEYMPELIDPTPEEEEKRRIMYMPRALMVDYTVEFENKMALLEKKPGLIFVLTFCGDGYDWDSRLLADFAEFYLKGVHNLDDPYAKIGAEYLEKNKIIFKKNIDYFGYHERQKNNIKYKWYDPSIRRKPGK
jgi:hypothetical protein